MREQDISDKEIDPHYKQMLKYPDTPNSWYFLVFLLSFIVALVVIYKSDSTLPWWGFIISLLLATISILFFGALSAITGLGVNLQTFIQMIGGYLHRGMPVANMYFVLYSYNTVGQAQLLLGDLKIAQCAHVSIEIDPHYKQMLKYPDAPNSWYFLVFLLSFIVALVVIYKSDSTLPW
ncbi:hypothetical protein AZE42_08539 [Rhizopogon vesiculosus]|uniref:Uncharacterized protein n=1 Tax=Rhizopogon vesiculosus TaxID=180088 RepID=A0A1J8Q7S9_9AGAM|nr:hypothetical protein AZE42_08539 [Rhizopogon vesiculosus]